MTNTNTLRKCTAAAAKMSAGDADAVLVTFDVEGIRPDSFAMSPDEAKDLAESLLKAAGVKFKITVNA